jgi:hypothetical protein
VISKICLPDLIDIPFLPIRTFLGSPFACQENMIHRICLSQNLCTVVDVFTECNAQIDLFGLCVFYWFFTGNICPIFIWSAWQVTFQNPMIDSGEKTTRPKVGKSSSHFLKPLFTSLRVRTKSGLSHMMMVHTQPTLLKPLFPLLHVDCRKGAQYILGTAPTFPLFRPSPAF